MDKYGDIIFLAIIFISFVFSIVKNIRKEKDAKAQKTIAKKEQQVPTTKKPVAEPQTQPKVSYKMSRMSFPEEEEPISAIEAETNINTPPLLLNIQDTDEIKRAIIYSEILGRKYE